MKINSHLLGYGIAAAAVFGYIWFMEKEVEVFLGYRIYKKRGTFLAERVSGERFTNPTFDTIEKARAWIGTQVAMDKLKTAIPWGN
jgi:hypothetical protein